MLPGPGQPGRAAASAAGDEACFSHAASFRRLRPLPPVRPQSTPPPRSLPSEASQSPGLGLQLEGPQLSPVPASPTPLGSLSCPLPRGRPLGPLAGPQRGFQGPAVPTQPPSPAVVPPVPSWGRHPPSLPESPHLTPPGRLQGLLPPLPTQFRVRAPELVLRIPCQIALAGFCRQLQDAPVSVHFACQGRTQVSPPASPAPSPAGPGLCPGLPCVHSLALPPSSLPSHGRETPAQRGR